MTTALLLMDFQNAIAGRPGASEAVAAARGALEGARSHRIPVVFVRVAFREGLAEVSTRNKAFGALRRSEQASAYLETSPATQIVDALTPLSGEPVVTKRRVGAFASDLAVVLSGIGATDLVLAGISTSGVVLSTVRDAADRDFGLTVLADACFDGDPEVHRVLTEKVFPRQAEVTSTAAWLESLGRPAPSAG